MQGITKVVGFFDIHFPIVIPALWTPRKSPQQETPLLNFLKDFQPDVFIEGGDCLHLDCISHWNKGKVRILEGQRLSKDYEGYNLLLDALDKILDKSVQRKIKLTGNHEAWIDDLIESDPQSYEGIIEIEKNLNLVPRGYKIIPRRKSHREGKLHFIHGDYRDSYIPIFYAKALAQLYHRNLAFGHFHSTQSYIDVSPVDTHPVIAQGVGTLGATNPDWMKSKPNAWSNSFLVAYIHPDGNFNHTVVNVVRNRFVFNGVLYQ